MASFRFGRTFAALAVVLACLAAPSAVFAADFAVTPFYWNAQVVSVQGSAPTGAFTFSYGGSKATADGSAWTGWQAVTPAGIQDWLKGYPNTRHHYPVITAMRVTNARGALADETDVQVQISSSPTGSPVSYSYTAKLFGPDLGLLIGHNSKGQSVQSVRDYNAAQNWWPTFQKYALPAAQRPKKFVLCDRFESGDDDRIAWQDGLGNVSCAGANCFLDTVGDTYLPLFRTMLNNLGITRVAQAHAELPYLGVSQDDNFDFPARSQSWATWAAGEWAPFAKAGYAPEDVVLFGLSDEEGWYYPESYRLLSGDPNGLAEFQSYVKANVEQLTLADITASFGWTSWSQVQPVGRSQVNTTNPTLAQEELFYWTQCFFSQDANKWYHTAMTALQSNGFSGGTGFFADWNSFTGRLYAPGKEGNNSDTGNDAAYGGFGWLEFGRLGGGNMMWSDFEWMGDDSAPTGSFYCAKLRSAAQHNAAGASFGTYLIGSSGGAVPGGYLQKILTVAGSGGKAIWYYNFGPEYIFPENGYTDNPQFPSLVQQMAQGNKMIAQAEDVLCPGKPVPPKVAILWPRSSEMWDERNDMPAPAGAIVDETNESPTRNTTDYFAEAYGLYMALMNADIPADFVDEDDVVNVPSQYKVVYVTEPDVPWQSQQGLLNFMNAGGVLVTVTAAGQADRYDSANGSNMGTYGIATSGISEAQRMREVITRSKLPASGSGSGAAGTPLAGLSFTALGPRGTKLTYPANATVLATWSDNGTPAIVQAPCGSGYHVHYTWMPGYSYVASARNSRNALSTGFSAAVRSMVVYPVTTLAKVAPPVTVDRPMIETPLLLSDKGAAVTLLNWTGEEQKEVKVAVRVPFNVGSVESVKQGKLDFSRTEQGVTFNLPLGAADIVILRP